MMVKSLYFSRNRVLSRYTQVGKRLMFEVDNAKEPAILKGYQVAIRTQGVQPESREHFLCFINESVPLNGFIRLDCVCRDCFYVSKRLEIRGCSIFETSGWWYQYIWTQRSVSGMVAVRPFSSFNSLLYSHPDSLSETSGHLGWTQFFTFRPLLDRRRPQGWI